MISASISSSYLKGDKLRLELTHVVNEWMSMLDAEIFQNDAHIQNIEKQCREALNDLSRVVRELETMSDKEEKSRKTYWKERIKMLNDNAIQFGKDIGKLSSRSNRKREENSRKYIKDGFGGHAMSDRAIDYYHREGTSIQNSINAVDEMTDTGNFILGSLKTSREIIQGAHAKVNSVLAVLGLSSNLITSITKHEYYDRFILLAGMFITCLVLFCLYYFYIR